MSAENSTAGNPPKLDEETERLIRGVLTTFKPGHPSVDSLRRRITQLVEEARKNAVVTETTAYAYPETGNSFLIRTTRKSPYCDICGAEDRPHASDCPNREGGDVR